MTAREIFLKQVEEQHPHSTNLELLFLTSNEYYIPWLEELSIQYLNLESQVAQFYDETIDGDLCDIGELAAEHFGFL